jgi:hypothetical protein
MDNGPELVSQALQRFCDGKVGLTYISRITVGQRLHRVIQQPPAEGVRTCECSDPSVDVSK